MAETVKSRLPRCTKWPQEDDAASCPRAAKKLAVVTSDPATGKWLLPATIEDEVGKFCVCLEGDFPVVVFSM